MQGGDPRFKAVRRFYIPAITMGILFELIILIGGTFLIGGTVLTFYMSDIIPIAFFSFRIVTLFLALPEKHPEKIASCETIAEPDRIRQRKRRVFLEWLGFDRQYSFLRALCGTRDNHGFYGLWCFFSKLVHNFLFLLGYITYIILRQVLFFEYRVFPRMVIYHLFVVIYTTYYDRFVAYHIVSLREKAVKKPVKEKSSQGDILDFIN